jgi:hypothetical protein
MTHMDQRGFPTADGLISYLNACGGSDTFQRWDANGQPDLAAARRLAEDLRAMLGERLGVVASVDQSFNRVTLSLVLEPAKV